MWLDQPEPDQLAALRERGGSDSNPALRLSLEPREGTVAPFIRLTFVATESGEPHGARLHLNVGAMAGLASREGPAGP